MRASLFSRFKDKQGAKRSRLDSRRLVQILVLLCLLAMTWLTFVPVQATTFDHTQATVETGCQHFTFSTDGNPFPLCPGPFPVGGNCIWWGWEQWHLLGYNLPLNWGNAANWSVEAERFGLAVGTVPRVGSLAVFPIDDGVWAFSSTGHLAFVTSVNADGQTFNVTYQNYGDTVPMYTGHGYNVSYINQSRFQNGRLRFIYFPRTIDPKLFAKLPGINGDDLAGVHTANSQLTSGSDGALVSGRVALGLPPGSYDQEFSADFAGTGYTNLLLYDRQQGRLDVLALSYDYRKYFPHLVHGPFTDDPLLLQQPYRVSLQDDHTPANGWGQNLDIHVGDFTGSGHTEILLYDRVSGQIQLLTLTPQFTIATHVTLNGWGPGWEVYVGRFDGQHSDLLLYKRFAIPTPVPTPTPGPGGPTPGPQPSPSPNPNPHPSPVPSPSPSPVPSPSPSPSPSPVPSPSPSSSPSPVPSPTSSPTPSSHASLSSPQSQPAVKTSGVIPNSGATQADGYYQNLVANTPSVVGNGEPVDTSGQSPATWNTSGLTADIRLVSFKQDFTVGATQNYSLWHGSWEIYIDRFSSANQDGVFLYDRNVGEARVLEYSPQLQLAHFQFLHNLGGSWEVHTGDFTGQGQAQLLLYDSSSGNAQMLILKSDLSLASTVSYSDWGASLVLYVGHFGMPSLSVMLYNPQQSQSTFIAFDAAANVSHQHSVQSWGQNTQILVGSFLDRALCLKQHTCSTGDDVLTLDRTTGMVQQYVFSFGNQFSVFDNRSQAFLRDGIAAAESVLPVDASSFSLSSSMDETIHDEELY